MVVVKNENYAPLLHETVDGRYSISLVFHWWEMQVDVPASLSLYTGTQDVS